MPWKVLQALVGLCWHEHWYQLGLCLLLGFSFFLRTQGSAGTHVSDIEVSPAEDTIVIRLRRIKTSKQHLQALTLEHPKMAALTASALTNLLISGCGHGLQPFFVTVSPPSASFFYVTPLGGGQHISMWSLKSLDFVMVQGRWKDQRTCRLYLDDARAMLVNFLPFRMRPCLCCRGNFAAYFERVAAQVW